MAENENKTAEKKKQSKQREHSTWSSTKILDCVAYFAVIFIALAMILKLAFKNNVPDVANAFAAVGECLAYIICMWLGFYWVMRQRTGKGWSKQKIWWLICWIVATVVIVVVYIFAY